MTRVTGSPFVTRARRRNENYGIEIVTKHPVTPVTPVTRRYFDPYDAWEAGKRPGFVTGSNRRPVTTRYKFDRVFKLTEIASDARGDRVTGEALAHAIKGGSAP